MGKKSKRNRTAPPPSQETDSSRLPPALRRPDNEETKDNLFFEDPFVEEYEIDDDDDDEEWDDVEEDHEEDTEKKTKPKTLASRNQRDADDDDNEDEDDEDIVQAWNPLTGQALQAGEALEMDASAYKMHHALTHEWPALSFDFMRDDRGEGRTRFPHTLTVAVGSQADCPEHNSLTIMKLSGLPKIAVETDDDILGEEYNPDNDDDDDDDDDDDEEEIEPVLEHYSIPHLGGVNRVRVMPQRSEIVATWSDAGTIHLFNVDPIRQRFAASDQQPGKGGGFFHVSDAIDPITTKSFCSYTTPNHTEGYAMDWSTVAQGHLVTADCQGNIQLWAPRPEGNFAITPFYETNNNKSNSSGHPQRSIEDLQWSPTEATVFATAECEGYVRIFDTRAPSKAMLTHQIHASNVDVNVLSWNNLVSNLLATGGDDGTLAAWDLRHFQPASPTKSSLPSPLARFTPHKTPITSVEWHPTDESMLATSDDVGAYIYDLSVEEDDTGKAAASTTDVPPQLLFVHCGSEQFKEVHWHPQISSCLMTTALTGFSVFIPSNL